MHSNSIGCPKTVPPLLHFCTGYRIWHSASWAWKRKTGGTHVVDMTLENCSLWTVRVLMITMMMMMMMMTIWWWWSEDDDLMMMTMMMIFQEGRPQWLPWKLFTECTEEWGWLLHTTTTGTWIHAKHYSCPYRLITFKADHRHRRWN